MANTITGRIMQIGPTQTITGKSGATIQKREIVLDCTRYDPYTGERGFENFPALEFSGDKCRELDIYQAGEVVTIQFDVVGQFYVGQDGLQKNFTRVKGYKIERRNIQQPVVAQQVQPAQPIAKSQQSQKEQLLDRQPWEQLFNNNTGPL